MLPTCRLEDRVRLSLAAVRAWRSLCRGAHVVLAGRHSNTLDAVADQVCALGRESLSVVTDVTDGKQVVSLVDATMAQFGRVDILVNNAGITMDNLSLRMKNDEWQKVIDINLSSTFYLCKYAIKKMLKNKYGRVVNITSIVGHTGNLGQSNYAASKAGMVAMSKSLAIEYAKKNITINCVSPGFIQSKMTDKIVESIKAVLTSRIPMSKLGTGEDVANSVAFLSSDAASYITGETIHVNGGMYMG